MDKILQELDSTFKLISSIPVSGEAVDLMAAARNNLRKIHAEIRAACELEKKKEEVPSNGSGT